MSKEAMKLALEALEEPHPGVRTSFTDALTYREKVKQAITALREALAKQPARQEPVAWYRDEDGIRIYYESKVWDDATPLYTSPQPAQRTWVGLTDEDWGEINDMPDVFDQGVAWAQARLKEKNT